MRCFGLMMGMALAFVGSQSSGAITLAKEGEATVAVVRHEAPTVAERTAAQELANYLGRVTGAAFDVVSESKVASGPAIYVGWTAFARNAAIDLESLGPEEWVIRTVDGSLVLAGGRPRGTLYAVYRFLEETVGVHWWNPLEESVPTRPTLTVGDLDLRGQPAIRYRDIYMLYGHDKGRFAARNRLDRDGDAGIAADYGGERGYGLPAHVHTFHRYVPPDPYLETHPEWFSLIDGKRRADRAQLCLTNPELREFVLDRLKGYIAKSRATAKKQGRPAPTVFDISQNDCGGMCQCESCQAIAEAEGSEAGPLFDFVNAMADAIKDEYPDVYIDTLAYQMTQKVPKTIRPRDNVIVRLCDTTSNFTRPITHLENAAFKDHVLSWAAITKNLRIWDYAVNYGQFHGLPMPSVHTYAADFQFYAEHNVEGVFTELEYPILADMRDLKVWMMMKLLEDPYRDYDALLRTFTDGFYGAAGDHIRQYLAQREAAVEAKPTYMSMRASPASCTFLDLSFVREAMGIFDAAEQAVADDPVLLRRVRHARLSLDRAAVVTYRTLMDEWLEAGNTQETMPLDRVAIAERCKDTWYTETDFRVPEGRRATKRVEADQEIRQLLKLPSAVPLPERFSDLPRDSVHQYTAGDFRNWHDVVKRVQEKDAPSGIVARLDLSSEDLERYKLPMPWGLYDTAGTQNVGSGVIRPEDVPGPGYHWYKMGTFPIPHASYVYFFWSWIIQADVGNLSDPVNPAQRFDIWALVKFEGPGFPHGKPDELNAIFIERLILVEANAQSDPR
ncbi:MAG: DUF4838 domain-containing protein [bacterium]|nr:DUF4838 domain-containing protein [bacterium]